MISMRRESLHGSLFPCEFVLHGSTISSQVRVKLLKLLWRISYPAGRQVRQFVSFHSFRPASIDLQLPLIENRAAKLLQKSQPKESLSTLPYAQRLLFPILVWLPEPAFYERTCLVPPILCSIQELPTMNPSLVSPRLCWRCLEASNLIRE